MTTGEWSCFDFICMGSVVLFGTDRERKIQNENMSTLAFEPTPRHSTTGESAPKTARPRRLDDDMWFNVLQDSVIQFNKIITLRHVSNWLLTITTDRPKSFRNCCLIELFCGVVCVVTLPFWHFCWCRGFCHRTGSDLLLFVMITCVFELCEVSIEHLQRVRHANRRRLLLRTPGIVPLWDLHVF